MKIRKKKKTEPDRKKLYKIYKRQKNKELWQYLFGTCIIVFGFLASIIFALLRLLGQQDKKFMRDAFVLISPEIFVMICSIISGISLLIFLVFLVQRKENFQWFAFHFFRKDFTPSKRWALVYYKQGKFIICKTTSKSPMTGISTKIKLDTRINVNVLTTERESGGFKDNGYQTSFWVQLGFVNELTISLMEKMFFDVDVFIAEAKKVVEKALRQPLQNLGWGNKKVSKDAVALICKRIQVHAKGIPLRIKESGPPRSAQPSESYWQPGSQIQQKKKEPSSQQIEKGLKNILALQQKQKSAEETDQS